MKTSSQAIYVDHSATTKVRPEVVEAMMQVLQEDFGNPSSIHRFGQKAKQRLDEARANVASLINAKEEQIFFTSGGTESNNIVTLGLAKYFEEIGVKNKDKYIITTKIEHPSVKEPIEYLERKGWRVTWLNVDKEGFIDLEELQDSINSKTLLVSIIHANNEIGTIQDLKKISDVCKRNNVLFHIDAVQSFGKIPIDVSNVDIDFMSMSGHKIYGPKGVGALYVKDSNVLTPLLFGGGQENNVRPGTENIPGIVGFGVACKLLKDEIYENVRKLRKLQIDLMKGLLELEDLILTGVSLDKVKENILNEKYLYRLPGHISFCVKGVEGENLVLQMDLRGIAVSSGSACSSRNMNEAVIEPSHVLLAIGILNDYVKGSLRLTLGRENTKEDVDYVLSSLEDVIKKLRSKSIV